MVKLDSAFLNPIGSGFLMRSRNVKIVNISDQKIYGLPKELEI